MNVVVALNDGSQIYPSYAPDNTNSILAFYSEAVSTNQIAGYVATFNDGSVVAEGQVL
jgi:hypothetical protein